MKQVALHILRTLLAGIAVGMAFSLIVVLFGWITRWPTALQFSNGLFVAGSAIILFGLLSAWGGFTSRGDFTLTYAQTDSDLSLPERAKWLAIEVLRGYNIVGFATVVGAIMIAMSVLTYQLFG